ncbi:hypothetical protein EUGRSUZ_H02082 [Eucalyptus grandis]|uniref:Uncharacterized protein n=2 Tax=Eucalyptus grandis TaxID=71139 RepID=A0ACC3JQ47_EUCGR|nr:hypothetical protein EUGRSUZ_H02082 [Eucalyptus grandis]
MTERNVPKPTLARWDIQPRLLSKLVQRGSGKCRSTNLKSIHGDRAGLHRNKRSTVMSDNRTLEPGLQVRQLP